MAICVLNHLEVKAWEESGKQIRPGCKFHRHLSYKKALAEVEDDNAFWVPELRAIVRYTCVDYYVWQGKRSAGFSAMQLCPIKGRQGPLALCREARLASQ